MSERHETPPPKLLDRLRAKTRLPHSSIRTKEAYAAWVATDSSQELGAFARTALDRLRSAVTELG